MILNSWDAIEFPPFFFIFNQKMVAFLVFGKIFQLVFQMAQQNPREVIVWKFEGLMSNGLVATRGTNKEIDYIINIELVFS